MKKLNSIIACLILSSCAQFSPSKKTVEKPPVADGPIQQDTVVTKQDKTIEMHEFKVYHNEEVQKWIDYFTKKDRERFQRFIDRGAYYSEVIQTVLEEEQLPHILYYLPLIESGFNNRAHSHAGAVGPWQFIKGTAKRYGLMVNSVVDERRDPILSTEAATKYLTDLYNVFNSWELAIAAYNCGEMRVLRAIMRGKTRDFWELSKRKLLPRETRNYVPKFLAAATVGENLKKYAFNESPSDRYPDVESFDIPGGLKVYQLARSLQMSTRDLKKLNPALKRGQTPRWLKTYSVWLPPKKSIRLAAALPSLRKTRVTGSKVNVAKTYKVRRGDNLYRIARKFKISINRLKRINNLANNRIYPGQRLSLSTKKYKKVSGQNFYFVKANDTLGKISRKYGLSLRYLKKLNGLHNSRIYVGQKIDITKGVSDFQYKVRKGDNLALIAKLYNTTTYDIKKKNQLNSNTIYAGQLLNM